MKKIILIIMCFLLCGCVNKTAKDASIEYLQKFKNHEEEVMISLNELIKVENLDNEQASIYTLIMKKQYDDMEYKIIEETYNGDKATIKVEITVYDFLNSKEKSEQILEEQESEFTLEDGSLNIAKYKNLQLKNMESEKRRIKYSIIFSAYFEENTWKLENPNYTVLQKIHGIYDYTKD